MAANWMLRASATWQDQKIQYEDNSTVFGGSFQDPTNIPFTNNEWSPGIGILGSRWSVKVVGAYQFPWDLTVGAYYKIIDGNASPIFVRRFQNYRQGALDVLLKPFDAERFDTVQYMDLRAEKGIDLRRYGTLFVIVDVFNVFNTNTAVKIERRANAFQFREPQEIVNPRIFRFGLRYTF